MEKTKYVYVINVSSSLNNLTHIYAFIKTYITHEVCT
jgi:hypothetical protein